jgi:micrococcal nuclease
MPGRKTLVAVTLLAGVTLIVAIRLVDALKKPAPLATFSGMVVSIGDGDSFIMLRDGKEVRVRLEGIDCPERGQAFGARARELTSSLAYRKQVTVQVKGIDQHQRILGVVTLGNGMNLNQELVRSGYAWRYLYSKDEELAALEAEARIGRRGLWVDSRPVAPWDYRRNHDARAGE